LTGGNCGSGWPRVDLIRSWGDRILFKLALRLFAPRPGSRPPALGGLLLIGLPTADTIGGAAPFQLYLDEPQLDQRHLGVRGRNPNGICRSRTHQPVMSPVKGRATVSRHGRGIEVGVGQTDGCTGSGWSWRRRLIRLLSAGWYRLPCLRLGAFPCRQCGLPARPACRCRAMIAHRRQRGRGSLDGGPVLARRQRRAQCRVLLLCAG
jgi:hypothetical protein